MQKLRTGVIGTGFGLKVQVPGLQRHPASEVVAIASGTPGKAARVAAEHGIPRAFDDWREMLEQMELDLVLITTPVDLHHPMAVKALEKGCHVLLEKPMAMNLTEARELTARAADRNLVAAMDFEFRYESARTKLKQLTQEGFLGPLHQVNYTWSGGFWGAHGETRPHTWLSQAERGGGMLGALASHAVDSLRWWFGDIARVCGYTATTVKERPDAAGVMKPVTADDNFGFLVEFAGGGHGMCQYIASATHPRGTRLEVFGRDGTVIIENDQKMWVGKAGEALAEVALKPLPVPGLEGAAQVDPRLVPFLVLLDNMVAVIRGESRDLPSFADGAAAQAVLDAVRASGAGWIEVK